MTTAEATSAPSKRNISLLAQQTLAQPKHSLFGTTLEHYEKEELPAIVATKANPTDLQRQSQQYPVPDHLKHCISAQDNMEKTQRRVQEQNRIVSDVCADLEEKEKRALMFKPDPTECLQENMKGMSRIVYQDLEHAEEINNVGLNKTGSFNRDKYGKKPPTHNYSLIGNLLSPGNDFGYPQRYHPDDTLLKLNKQSNNVVTDGAIRLGFNTFDYLEQSQDKSKKKIKVPANIKHQFGSRVCEELLSNEKAVEDFLQQQKEQRKPAEKHQETPDIKEYEAAASNSYFELGCGLRANLFPDHSVRKPQGIFKAVHNAEVYLRREPMKDQFRRKRDEHSIWAEQNIVLQNLRKGRQDSQS